MYPTGYYNPLKRTLGVHIQGAEMAKGLGDLISSGLAAVGITEEKVSGWLGRPCGCRQRKEKLNKLSEWAGRVLSGNTPPAAVQELAELTEDPTLSSAISPTIAASPKLAEGVSDANSSKTGEGV